MRRIVWCLLIGFSLLASSRVLAGDDFKVEPGFTLLFNGKSLDGWKAKTGNEALDGKTDAYKGRFKVAAGKIVIDPSVKGDVHIVTAKEFKDVHIKFEFRPTDDKCNNDLFLRGLKFDIVAKGLAKVLKAEGWNELEIIASGDKAEVKINGQAQKTYGLKAPASPFSIRAEFGGLEIRHLRAKE